MTSSHRAAAVLAVAAALLLAGTALADGGGRPRPPRARGGDRVGPNLQVPLAIRVHCTEVHGVRAGETCASVARGARLAEPAFLQLNPNVTCAALFPGQWVCVDGEAVA